MIIGNRLIKFRGRCVNCIGYISGYTIYDDLVFCKNWQKYISNISYNFAVLRKTGAFYKSTQISIIYYIIYYNM